MPSSDPSPGEVVSGAVLGVVFDMDGVLVDSGAHHRAAWLALLGDVGVTPPPGFWRVTIGRPAEEAVALLLGKDISPAQARELANRKREHYGRLARRGVVPVAGAGEFVASVRRAGLPCAVATSATRTDVSRLLRAVHLAGQFDAVVTADDIRFGKPNPEVYQRAAEALGVPAARCLAFEDSIAGVEAACGAGMRVIGVESAHTDAVLREAGAIRSIESFEGLSWPVRLD